jgi:hypothetical protein
MINYRNITGRIDEQKILLMLVRLFMYFSTASNHDIFDLLLYTHQEVITINLAIVYLLDKKFSNYFSDMLLLYKEHQ